MLPEIIRHRNDIERLMVQEMPRGRNLITSTILSGTAASIDWQNIQATWKNLYVVWSARGDDSGGGGGVSLYMRYNNDTGSNYSIQLIQGYGTTTQAAEVLSAAYFTIGYAPNAAATSGFFGNGGLSIPDYATSMRHNFNSNGFSVRGITSTYLVTYQMGGIHNSAAVLSRITIYPAAGNFVAGSAFWLYGE